MKINDFPYFFEDNVEHYCLWKLKDELSDCEILNAIKQLQKNKKFGKNYAYYINPPNLKSILEVHHAHILIKTEPINLSFHVGRFWLNSIENSNLIYLQKTSFLKYSLYGGVGIFGLSVVMNVLYNCSHNDIQDIAQQFTAAKWFW